MINYCEYFENLNDAKAFAIKVCKENPSIQCHIEDYTGMFSVDVADNAWVENYYRSGGIWGYQIYE